MRTRCSRIGTKSFELEHVISRNGRVVAEAKSVLVSYDYERGESLPVPDELRERLAASGLRLAAAATWNGSRRVAHHQLARSRSSRPGRLNVDLGEPDVCASTPRPDAVPRPGPSSPRDGRRQLPPVPAPRAGRLPVYYFPPEDVRRDLLDPAGSRKGRTPRATCYRSALRVGDRSVPDAAWSYSDVPEAAAFLNGLIALDWDAMDEWFCGGGRSSGIRAARTTASTSSRRAGTCASCSTESCSRRRVGRRRLRDQPAAALLHPRRGRPCRAARAVERANPLRVQGLGELLVGALATASSTIASGPTAIRSSKPSRFETCSASSTSGSTSSSTASSSSGRGRSGRRAGGELLPLDPARAGGCPCRPAGRARPSRRAAAVVLRRFPGCRAGRARRRAGGGGSASAGSATTTRFAGSRAACAARAPAPALRAASAGSAQRRSTGRRA